jgi:hypothetical protein
LFTRNRGLKASTFGALLVAGLIVFQGVAAAHHPEIQATPQCVSGTLARITVTTSAWATPDASHRINSNVQLTVGSQTFPGAFTAANGYQFSVTLDVPANGATYTARATAVAPWGPNGEFGSAGEFRETTVTAPLECVVAPTTSTTSTTSTTVPTTTLPPTTPSSSVAPTTAAVTTTAPPTTIGVQVGGIIEERVNVLARTGAPVTPLLVLGLSFIVLGAIVELRARRRRHA